MEPSSNSKSMDQIERVCRECFWDYQVSLQDIETIFRRGSYEEKKKLFFRILYHSTDRLLDLRLFSEYDLRRLFNEPLPPFKSKYMDRRVAVLRAVLLHENIPVKGLEWKKR